MALVDSSLLLHSLLIKNVREVSLFCCFLNSLGVSCTTNGYHLKLPMFSSKLCNGSSNQKEQFAKHKSELMLE